MAGALAMLAIAACGTAPAEVAGPDFAEQRLMLVPGFLLSAEREDLVRTADALTMVTIPPPFGR